MPALGRILVLLALVMSLVPVARPARAQATLNTLRDFQDTFFSVSPRLLFYTLVETRPPGTDRTLAVLMQGLGFLHKQGQGPQPAWNFTSVQPVLRYEPNINGGLPGDQIEIGSLIFQIDEDSQAVSGPVVGAELGKSIGWSVGTGQTLSVSGTVELVYSPDYKITQTNANLQTCLRSYLEQWRFLDICGGAIYEQEDLGEANTQYLSANYAKAFSSGAGTHLANIFVLQEFQDRYEKASLSLGLESYLNDFGVVTGRVAWGQKIEGENTLLYGAYVNYGRPVLGVGTNIGLSWEREGGDVLFGSDRSDDVITLDLTAQISPTLSATLSIENRQSSIDLFDGTAISLDLNVLRMRF